MRARTPIIIALKVIALTLIYFLCFAVVAALVLPPADVGQSSSEQTEGALAMLAVCFLNTAVLAYIILRSRQSGWALALSVWLILFGITTLMSQIESAFFLTRLPAGMLPRLFILGVLVAAIFSPAAVFVLKRKSNAPQESESSRRLTMPMSEWMWKLSLIAFAYLILYFTFGYFIAWKSPAVREYYGGTDPGSFFAQMRSVFASTPWLIPFQVLRALLWTALAVLIIRTMKGRWLEVALATATAFAVLMNTQLLLPNPLMPEAVRMAHLLETATSNFIFGCLTVWLLGLRSGWVREPLYHQVNS